MAPNTNDLDVPLAEHEAPVAVGAKAAPRKYSLVYVAVLAFSYWHLGGLYGLYLCFTSAQWKTILFNAVLYYLAMEGGSIGGHRLWAHRSFKAKMPLEILLMLMQTLMFQLSAFDFARDHRLHHKYSDTDADPYNSARGFFFAHIGWLLVRKHPETVRKGKTFDWPDLNENPVLQFQKKYYFYLSTVLTFVLPVLIPVYFWQETLSNAHHVTLLRVIVALNAFFTTNSLVHFDGPRPYDKRIVPSQSLFVSFVTFGEGYHNFHHVFPFDYRAAETGNNFLNFSATFIEFFEWVGWAYDLKHASEEVVAKRIARTGDGSDHWGRMKTDLKNR